MDTKTMSSIQNSTKITRSQRSPFDSLEEAVKRFHQVAMGVEDVADSFCGSTPQSIGSEKSAGASGAFNRANAATDELLTIADRIDAAARRLRDFL